MKKKSTETYAKHMEFCGIMSRQLMDEMEMLLKHFTILKGVALGSEDKNKIELAMAHINASLSLMDSVKSNIGIKRLKAIATCVNRFSKKNEGGNDAFRKLLDMFF